MSVWQKCNQRKGNALIFISGRWESTPSPHAVLLHGKRDRRRRGSAHQHRRPNQPLKSDSTSTQVLPLLPHCPSVEMLPCCVPPPFAASPKAALASRTTVVCRATTEAADRTAVPKAGVSAHLSVLLPTAPIRRDISSETAMPKARLASNTTVVCRATTEAAGRTTIPKAGLVADISVLLPTTPIRRDISSEAAMPKARLAPNTTVACRVTTKPTRRATISKRRPDTHLPPKPATRPIRRHIPAAAAIAPARTRPKRPQTPRPAVILGPPAIPARRTTLAKPRPGTDLAVAAGPAAAVGGDVPRVHARPERALAARPGPAVGRGAAAPAGRRAAVAVGSAGAAIGGGAAAGAVGGRGAWPGDGGRGGVAVAVEGLARWCLGG